MGHPAIRATTQESDPDWTLFNRREGDSTALYVRAGRLRLDVNLPDLKS
jgi:hypothetical protein